MSAVFFEDLRKDKNSAHTSVSLFVENKKNVERRLHTYAFSIKGLIWPPLEPKTESCFDQFLLIGLLEE